MRASWFIGVLCLLCAPAMAADFFVKDPALTALPEFPDGVVRSHWTFTGYEGCRVVGKPVNLADWGKTEGYFATTADRCGWMADAGPIWVVQRIDGALELTLADHGYSAEVAKPSRNGMRHVSVAALLTGWSFENLWEFNGARYVNTVRLKEAVNRTAR